MGLNGLPQRIFNEIAKDQKIVHLWLKEIFELKSNTKADKMMDEMMETFQKEVLEPTLPKLIQGNADPRRVTRAVFIVLPIYLERKAISGWIRDNQAYSPMMFPQGPRAVLPEINSPHEAAELAARELMLNPKEIEVVRLIVKAAEGVDHFPEGINNILNQFYSDHSETSTSLHRLNSTQAAPTTQQQEKEKLQLKKQGFLMKAMQETLSPETMSRIQDIQKAHQIMQERQKQKDQGNQSQ